MDHSQAISDYTQDFLSRLGLPGEITLTVQFDESASAYKIQIDSQDPSMVIGYHGENLSSLQLILSQHLHAKLGEWVNLVVNVNDYRERRETSLHGIADAAVQKVIATGQSQALPPMSANERRIIHLHLADHPQVLTSSQGEGRSRSVVISPRV